MLIWYSLQLYEISNYCTLSVEQEGKLVISGKLNAIEKSVYYSNKYLKGHANFNAIVMATTIL